MSFKDIGLVTDVFQYLKWTFPLALFTDYYDRPVWASPGATYNFSNLRLNNGVVGYSTQLIGR